MTETVPPTFIWSTATDEIVPIQHSIRMANALADVKVPFELHIFEEGKHGLSVADQTSSGGKKREVQPLIQLWVSLAHKWLQSGLPMNFQIRRQWICLWKSNKINIEGKNAMKTIKDKEILVGADFAGFPLKEAVVAHLKDYGWKVTDIGVKR